MNRSKSTNVTIGVKFGYEGYVGLFLRASAFLCSFSAESCSVNLLYGISKLLCKIDQRDLEKKLYKVYKY